MPKNIIKEIKGKKYELTYQGVQKEFGKLVKHSAWMSLEKNDQGEYDTLEYVCKVPEGYKDIDLKTLNTNCLTNDIPANKQALVK